MMEPVGHVLFALTYQWGKPAAADIEAPILQRARHARTA